MAIVNNVMVHCYVLSLFTFLMQLFVVEICNVRRECVSDFVVLVLGAVLRVRQYVTPVGIRYKVCFEEIRYDELRKCGCSSLGSSCLVCQV